MAKVGSISLTRLAGDQRGKMRAAWSAPAGEASHKFIKTKGGSAKLWTKKRASCVEKYEYRWRHKKLVISGSGSKAKYVTREFVSDWQTTGARQVELSIPDGATSVWIEVRPVSKKYKYYPSKDAKSTKEKSWIQSDIRRSATCNTGAFHNPERPTIQSVSVGEDGRTVTVKCQSGDPYAETFEVEIYSGSNRLTGTASLKSDSATFAKSGSVAITGAAGTDYHVRARMKNVLGDESSWTVWPDTALTSPAAPGGLAAARNADGTCTVRWGAVAAAEGYEVAYGDSDRAMAATGDYKTKTGITSSSYTFTDLEAGKGWWFWVRAVNKAGEGPWSAKPVYVLLGSAPDAPSVWADAYVAVRGESVTVGWQHNASDNSPQGRVRLRVKRGAAGAWQEVAVAPTATEAVLSTDGVPDGDCLSFCVNTWGVDTTAAYMSPDSEVRTVRVWQRPSMRASVPAVVEGFPFSMTFDPVADKQHPAFAGVSIYAREAHYVTESDGNERYVAAGALAWQGSFRNPADPLVVTLSAGDVALSDGQAYDVVCECVMSSGLTCEAKGTMSCDFADAAYVILGELEAWGEWGCEVTPAAIVPPAVDEAGPEPADGWESDVAYAQGVVLSIYRIESDGSLSALMRNIPNDGSWSLVDDHAARGRWRYRITAQSLETGRVWFKDFAQAVENSGGIVITWGQENAVREHVEGEDVESAEAGGVVLYLPWTVSTVEDADPDVEYVEYIGREDPVSYWGTHKRRSAKWTCQIPRDDADSLDKLRALQVLRGEAYARGPLGEGWWCGVKVSLSAPHLEGVIDVSLDLTPTDTKDECIVLSGEAQRVVEGGNAA